MAFGVSDFNVEDLSDLTGLAEALKKAEETGSLPNHSGSVANSNPNKSNLGDDHEHTRRHGNGPNHGGGSGSAGNEHEGRANSGRDRGI